MLNEEGSTIDSHKFHVLPINLAALSIGASEITEEEKTPEDFFADDPNKVIQIDSNLNVSDAKKIFSKI
ncbi:MAG TPA: hypothetical protein VFP93_05080 [Gammaproteobacteria bacterium]|nr:hypothetical protein [Gammaproteobacteria bacterium]